MAKREFRDYIELLKLLRIDVFFLAAIFAAYMPSVTVNQLAQDKYCLNTHSANESICLNLEDADDQYASLRNEVLEKATTLKMYTIILTTIPGLFFSLFLGYWIDAYPSHIRYLLAFGPLSMVLQNLIIIYQCIHFEMDAISLLYAGIPPALTGSIVVIMTGSYTYTTRKTPAKYRALRFTILELFLFISIPLSTTAGGSILAMEPWVSHQPRNYIGVLSVATISAGFAAIWVAVLLNDAEYDTSQDEITGSTKETPNNGTDINKGQDEGDKRHQLEKEVHHKQRTVRAIILDIVNIRNVMTTFHTTFKKRDHNGRFSLLIIMVAMAACMIGYMGDTSIGFQYSQRVYHWSAEYYSYMSASMISIPMIVTVIFPPLLIHKFHLHDTAVGILGSFSLSAALFARGLILSTPGFFAGVVLGSFVGLLPIANRSIVSRIIRNNEIGQVYAVLSCIESAGPMISSVFYSKIFNATIEDSPGTVYIAAGFVVLFPAGVMAWLYHTRNTWDLVLREEKARMEAAAKETGTIDDNKQHPSTTSVEIGEISQNKSPPLVNKITYRSRENTSSIGINNNTNFEPLSESDLESSSPEITLGKVELVIDVHQNNM